MTAATSARLDVTNSVDVTSAPDVARVLRELMERRFGGHSFEVVDTLVADLARLYAGEYPGYHACDVKYHDLQHVLDVSLAMARLIDGHEMACPGDERLGAEAALAGLCAALFHDAGYIRRRHDTRHRNGAAYTRVHVRRSARWLREYLPSVGLGHFAARCARIVHFTNARRSPTTVQAGGRTERRLGELLGTADLLAQLADEHYIEKCRDYLYDEFVEGGIAGAAAAEGYIGTRYDSPEALLANTPAFIRWAIRERLDEGFHGAYEYATRHFQGRNPYMDAIRRNYRRLEASFDIGP